MNLLPNLIIVGVAKSGTTSLFHQLKENPEIFIPEIKECRFFSQMSRDYRGGEAAKFQNEGPRDIKSYIKLFRNGKNKYLIDISNDYFYYYEKSIKNIKNTYKEFNLPEPKILIILRNPIKRVYSMYHHIIRLKSDNLDFNTAFAQSTKRIENNFAWMFDLKGVGLSFKGCEAYLKNFNKVKFLLHDEFKKNNFMDSVYEFMELKKPNQNKISISNQNDYILPRNKGFNFVLSKLKELFFNFVDIPNKKNSLVFKTLKKIYIFILNINKQKSVSTLEKSQIEMLSNFYRDDINKLSTLLKIDLTHWLSS